MKRDLLEEISIYLLKKGYTLKSLTRTCFDIVARKDTQILLIKVLNDANAISEEYAEEMKHVSSYISGIPLMIAEKAGDKLVDGVVYSRFGINTLNQQTFENCVESRFPFIKRDHAGLTANVIGNRLKEKMDEEGVSLGDLSKKLGVSKKMIQKYKSGESKITVQKAFKLYDIFGHAVFDKIDVLKAEIKPEEVGKSDVSKKYQDLGFEAIETHKVPFDILAKKEKEIILTEVRDKPNPQAQSLSRLLDADNLVIFKKKKPKDIPSLKKEEFLELKKAKELVKFLKEF
ncbi:helix-turn-helix domain-containing protein [Candidatus Woesearchaeota archaeon]|nr:helix-turn-helix domain-containing protein [Candidatus Woesearchaeota archaeon]